MTRYFELYKDGEPLNHAYEDQWADGIPIEDINSRLLEAGVAIREISKQEFESFPKL